MKEVHAVVEDTGVNDAIRSTELSEFLPKAKM